MTLSKLKSPYYLLSFISILVFSTGVHAFFDEDDDSDTDDFNNQLCWKHTKEFHSKTDLDEEVEDYQILAERALSYRAETTRIAIKLKQKITQNEPLSGKDLETLNQGMVAHLSLRNELYNTAYAHECWNYEDPHDLLAHNIKMYNRLKGVMLSLSAALILYDNYLLAITIFENDKKLRRVLNDQDSGYKIGFNELLKVTNEYISVDNRNRTRSAIIFYEQHKDNFPYQSARDDQFDYLITLIDQSPSYGLTKTWSPLHILKNHFRLLKAMTEDLFRGVADEGVNLFSLMFGNTIGLVESRKGKLHGDKAAENKILTNLTAGDILLEKTPFRLTDTLIPGHWGHAAIWIGDKKELIELGIWEHPVLIPYQSDIENGLRIVEALRAGVQLSTLSHFLNIDDMAILREEHSTKQNRAELIVRALRQVGKDYDFNFDVETTDKIVCSELVYIAYTDIKWPTQKTVGRSTISPDHVAEKTLNDGPLRLVMLYHDGQHIAEEPLDKLEQLMNR